ncbi:hypothetical protein [Gordonia neofelifaecis]|uniref:Uncharacterized protein n=1 Tax=Gordonia neofelifaecis NRRL B-59395 TaxID=644548 RepID=F1YE95_9ACTN|nr:hypothetical protein [Gordonia neofelifaecis]EGD56728.1 hypothetical protein SCNU_00080 [Gordonia neofelifaecis NRRL B-59395]
MSAAIKCYRCRRRLRRADGWNFEVRNGEVVGHLCPRCQTPEENAEAEINAATIRYGYDDSGHLTMTPKF